MSRLECRVVYAAQSVLKDKHLVSWCCRDRIMSILRITRQAAYKSAAVSQVNLRGFSSTAACASILMIVIMGEFKIFNMLMANAEDVFNMQVHSLYK